MNKCNYKKYSHNNLAVARRFSKLCVLKMRFENARIFSKPLGFEKATEYFKNFVNF